MEKNAKVAIIGGGISGLSVAYTLSKHKDFEGTITIFEKSLTLGGNADTAEVVLGYDHRTGEDFRRLADMGVNDINLDSYEITRSVMEEIGYIPKDPPKSPVNYNRLPFLEDTVCHFTPDSSELWTKDGFLMDDNLPGQAGVVDMRFSLNLEKHKKLREAEASFMRLAANDYNSSHAGEVHWTYTVDEYVANFLKRHAVKFSIDELNDLVRIFLKPRIAAMYFADDNGPGGMPMRGIMSYYRLQEGFGVPGKDDPEPDRRYFAKGSQDWINALSEWLVTKYNVKIRYNFKAKVMGDGENGVLVYRRPDGPFGLSEPERFDKVVMAAHADHQLQSFVPCEDPLITPEMADALASIRYSGSTSIAHTYAGVLPANVDSWRTYNVMIREDRQKTPYQMTYVQNRHRNDRMSDQVPKLDEPNYNEFGLPVYFVSLNPEINIPEEFILQTTEEERKRRMEAQPGYAAETVLRPYKEGLAVAYFRHTVMTRDLLAVQDDLPRLQKEADDRVYFAGCWTYGAGLHEECFQQAYAVVGAMFPDGA